MLKLAVGLLAVSSAFGATFSSSRSVSVDDGTVRALATFDGAVNTVVRLQEGVLSQADGTVTATGESLLFWISGFVFPRVFVQYLSGSASVDMTGSLTDVNFDQGVAFSAVFPAVATYTGDLTLENVGSLTGYASLDVEIEGFEGLASTDLILPTESDEPIKVLLETPGLALNFSITNQTITKDGVTYYPNQAKLDIELDLSEFSSTSKAKLTSGRKLALIGRLFAVGVTDGSAQVDSAISSGQTTSLQNDLSFEPADSSDYEGFFNWERTVSVTLKDGSVLNDVAVTALVVDDSALTVTAKARIAALDVLINTDFSGFGIKRTVWWTFDIPDISLVSKVTWDPEVGAATATSGTSAASMSVMSLVAMIILSVFALL